MKIKLNRNDELVDVNLLLIYIGDETYRLSESIDGKLNINKTSDGESDLIRIHPRTGNEIEIS